MPTLVLLRGDSSELADNDPYYQCGKELGINVIQIPVLSFNFINSDTLKEALNEDFDGIVFSSPRAVEAVKNVQEFQSFEGKVCFVVGSKTGSKVIQDLKWQPKENVIGDDDQAGNASKLAELIKHKLGKTGSKLLFPCGNLKRNELENGLQNSKIELKSLICYETLANPEIGQALENLEHVDFLTFFSPSGVKNAYGLVQKFIKKGAKIIAIGETTAETLRQEFKCETVLVAERPNAESVMQIVSRESS